MEEEFLNREVLQTENEENTKVSFIIGGSQYSDDANESLDGIKEKSEHSFRSNLSTSLTNSTQNGLLDYGKTLFKSERKSTRKYYSR
jgi:predicted nucleotidyltransferase